MPQFSNFQAQQVAQKKKLKQAKRIGPVCNPVTAYPLCSFASNNHISLILTLNRERFVALDS